MKQIGSSKHNLNCFLTIKWKALCNVLMYFKHTWFFWGKWEFESTSLTIIATCYHIVSCPQTQYTPADSFRDKWLTKTQGTLQQLFQTKCISLDNNGWKVFFGIGCFCPPERFLAVKSADMFKVPTQENRLLSCCLSIYKRIDHKKVFLCLDKADKSFKCLSGFN